MSKAEELAERLEYAAKCADMGRKPLDDDFRRLSAAELRRLSAEVESLRSERTAWRVTAENAEKQLEDLNTATTNLMKSFPVDFDMKEAGWDWAEINKACDAYDRVRLLLEKPNAE